MKIIFTKFVFVHWLLMLHCVFHNGVEGGVNSSTYNAIHHINTTPITSEEVLTGNTTENPENRTTNGIVITNDVTTNGVTTSPLSTMSYSFNVTKVLEDLQSDTETLVNSTGHSDQHTSSETSPTSPTTVHQLNATESPENRTTNGVITNDVTTNDVTTTPTSTMPTSFNVTNVQEDIQSDSVAVVNSTGRSDRHTSTGTSEKPASTTVHQLNMAETQIVPDPCGPEVMNLSDIFEHVRLHSGNNSINLTPEPCPSKATTRKTTVQSQTTLTTPLVAAQQITTTVPQSVSSVPSKSSTVSPQPPTTAGSGFGLNVCKNSFELLKIPDGENGTTWTSFSCLIQSIIEKSNSSEPVTPNVTSSREPCISTNTSRGSTLTGEACNEVTTNSRIPGLPVNEMKFQVSGINSGAVKPMHGGIPPKLPVPDSPLIRNVSNVLHQLNKQPVADNTSMQVFAETVSTAVLHHDVTVESDAVKEHLFKNMLQTGERLVDTLVTTSDIALSTGAVDISSVTVKAGDSQCMIDVQFGADRGEMTARLSTDVFYNLNTTEIRLSTMAFYQLETLSRVSNPYVSSSVMAVSVHAVSENQTKKVLISTDGAITFDMQTFMEQTKQEKQRLCSFWNFTLSNWSSAGCDVTGKNASHTSCTCNHLTNFAILVMYVETDQISIENEQVLFTLTTVGCSLSIACLLMALIAYVYLKMFGNEKVMIHGNLCVALLLAQIVFVSSSDAYKQPAACKAVALVLHFLFMSAFSWMMVEGIALYLYCTRGIFNIRDMRVKYFLLGWGAPLIIVIISFAARFPDYGKGPQHSCWLSVHDGLIWAFLGPMLLVVLLNMVVLGLVVRVFLTLKANSEKSEVARLRGSIRAMFTLLPLLGLTWILSLLVPISPVFHYFFVIANTVQGMCIFFLHCICNDEIRKKFSEARRRWSTTRTGSDAEMSYPGRRKLGSFDAVKAGTAATQLSAGYGNHGDTTTPLS